MTARDVATLEDARVFIAEVDAGEFPDGPGQTAMARGLISFAERFQEASSLLSLEREHHSEERLRLCDASTSLGLALVERGQELTALRIAVSRHLEALRRHRAEPFSPATQDALEAAEDALSALVPSVAPVEATPESAPPTAAQIEAWLWSHGWRVHTSHDDGSTWMTPLGNVVYVDRRDEKAPLRDYYLAKLALLHRATVAEITAEMLATETQKGGAA